MQRELAKYPVRVMTIYPTATDTDMMKTAKVDDMDTPEKVARAPVEGLVNEALKVILGGEKQRQMVNPDIS